MVISISNLAVVFVPSFFFKHWIICLYSLSDQVVPFYTRMCRSSLEPCSIKYIIKLILSWCFMIYLIVHEFKGT